MGVRLFPLFYRRGRLGSPGRGQPQAGHGAGQERRERRLLCQPPVGGRSAGHVHHVRKGRLWKGSRGHCVRGRPQGDDGFPGDSLLDGTQPHLHPLQEAHRHGPGHQGREIQTEHAGHGRHAGQAQEGRMHAVGRSVGGTGPSGRGIRQDPHCSVRLQDRRHVPAHGPKVQGQDQLLPAQHGLVRIVPAAGLCRGRDGRTAQLSVRPGRNQGGRADRSGGRKRGLQPRCL
mmetsp:Transcript_3715/g.8985  ORF Transcript_3715/g.8985 Transcript_3715/m.8985 type:complete len:230 (-) Transcript_3715:305-994(-)